MTQPTTDALAMVRTAKHNSMLGYSYHALSVRLPERGLVTDDIEFALNHPAAMIVKPGDKSQVSPSCNIVGESASGDRLEIVVAYKRDLVVSVWRYGQP